MVLLRQRVVTCRPPIAEVHYHWDVYSKYASSARRADLSAS